METISAKAFETFRQQGCEWRMNSTGDFVVKIQGVDFKVDMKGYQSKKQKKMNENHYMFNKRPPLGWGALSTLVRWHFKRESQKSFAKQLSVSQECISAWENGRNPVPAEKRKELLSMFMVVVNEMIDE